MTSLVSASYMCKRIVYLGISLLTKSLVRLKSLSLLPSRNCITRSVLKGIKGMDSCKILIYKVSMDLLTKLEEEVGSHINRASGSLISNSIAVYCYKCAKLANY